jgi:hypothetical protein
MRMDGSHYIVRHPSRVPDGMGQCCQVTRVRCGDHTGLIAQFKSDVKRVC